MLRIHNPLLFKTILAVSALGMATATLPGANAQELTKSLSTNTKLTTSLVQLKQTELTTIKPELGLTVTPELKLPLQEGLIKDKNDTRMPAMATANSLKKLASSLPTAGPHTAVLASNLSSSIKMEALDPYAEKERSAIGMQVPVKKLKEDQAETLAQNSYLHLAVTLSPEGKFKVISATQVEGSLVPSDSVLGDYIIDLAAGGRTLAAQAIQNPFEQRAFPPKEDIQHGELDESLNDPHGHYFVENQNATLVIKVPDFKQVEPLLDSLELKVLKLTEGPELDVINPKVLDKLREQYKLETIVEIPQRELNLAIKDNLKRLTLKTRYK